MASPRDSEFWAQRMQLANNRLDYCRQVSREITRAAQRLEETMEAVYGLFSILTDYEGYRSLREVPVSRSDEEVSLEEPRDLVPVGRGTPTHSEGRGSQIDKLLELVQSPHFRKILSALSSSE